MKSLLLLAVLVGLESCTTSKPRPTDLPPLVSTINGDSVGRPAAALTIPPPEPPPFLQRLVGGVFGGGAGKTKTTQKFKGPTTIILGNGNSGTAATKSGPSATGPSAVATDATKASGPTVVGEGNHTASSRKGPAVAGDGNSVTVPAPSNWWKWLLGGTVLGFCIRQFGPGLLRRLIIPV